MRSFLSTCICFFIGFSVLAQVDVEVDAQAGSSIQFTNNVEYLSDESVVAVGTMFGTTNFGSLSLSASNYDMFLVRYDADGDPVWARRGGGTSSDIGQSIAITPWDEIYVTGYFRDQATFGSTTLTSGTGSFFGEQGYIAKYDSAGNENWAIGITGPGEAWPLDVASDDDGSVFVLFQYSDTINVDTVQFVSSGSVFQEQFIVAKFDSSGSYEWAEEIEVSDSYYSSSTFSQNNGGIAIDTAGDVYATGNYLDSVTAGTTTLTSAGNYDMFLVKLDGSTGSVDWLRSGGGSSTDFGASIAVTDDNKIFVSGRGRLGMNFGSVSLVSNNYNDFVIRYNASGTAQEGWVSVNSAFWTRTNDIAVDTNGHWMLGGTFNGTLVFGSNVLSSGGGEDPYVIRYNYEGDSLDFIWTPEAAANSFESCRGVSTVNTDLMVAAGTFNQSMDFGNTSLSGSSYEGFVMKLGNCSETMAEITATGSTSLCTGENVTLNADTNGLYSYQWLYNGSSLGGEVSSSYTTSNAGTYRLVIDSIGCKDTSSAVLVTVNPLPNVTHSNIAAVCDADDPFQLTGGNPAGGTYSGGAYIIGGDTFDPGAAGLGTNQVVYSFTDTNGCADSVTKTVSVNLTPFVSNTTISACDGDAPVNLAVGGYGFPTGGTHLGTGVSGSLFDPSVAGVGTFTITYESSSGCQAEDNIVATVSASPNVTLSNIPDACISTSFTTLAVYGSPFGGSFSGSGVSSPFFFPGIAGVGTHDVVYTVTASGCTSSDTNTITVDPLADATFSALPQFCEGDADEDLPPYANPSGGTFSGTGVSDTIFSPVTAGVGDFTITYTYTNACGSDTAQSIASVGASPTASTTSTDVSCFGGTDGSATASATGGTSPYSYAWSSGANSATASNLAAGTYTVTVTDDNGCTDTDVVTINEPASAVLASTVVDQDVSCNGGNDGQATASATGGTSPYSFAWSSGGTAATETGLSAGTYTVTVTDDNGCTDTETVTITEPAALIASAVVDQNISCNGGADGQATASAAGGTTPYSFAWSSGGTAATETGLPAGTYTVTITDDNGCTDTETVTITEPTLLVASAVVDQDVSCFGGSDGEATASATGGTSPYSFSWSSGGTAATETGLTAGTYTVTVTDDNGCTDTESITITEPATAVAVSITGSTNVSCSGGNDGSATASATGGTSPYSFSWSSGGTTANETGLTAGTYTVTVTDGNGCTDTETVTITEPAALVASTVVDQDVSCNGGTDGEATASATGGTSPYTFAWSSGGTAATETGLSVGTYTVTVTDDNGCTDTETATITEPAALIASTVVDQNISCNGGNDGQATANATGGTSPYSFAWSSGGTAATETGLPAGTYTVTITDDNGCTDTETVTITEPTLLVASAVVDQDVSCFGGSDGEATASATGGTSPYSFSWSSGGTAATETGLTAGTYTVTVTDDNGCTDTESITITEPATAVAASITGSTNVSCSGGNDGSATVSATGGTSPYSFAWSSGGTTANETGLTAGTYTVTVTDDNGCTDTETVTITEPAALIASTVVDQNVSCNGGSDGEATAAATGGTSPYSFAWSSGGTAATETGLSAGTYTVTVTDDNGCTDTETATITEPATLIASTVVDQNISCNGGSDGQATANATGGTTPYSFAWSSGGTTATETGLPAGTYTVTITDDNGCTDTETVTITEPTLLVASAVVDQDVSCFGGNDGEATASATGGTSPYSFSWSSGGTAATETGLMAGTYTVTVTDDNGCTDTESITITEPATAVAASITGSTNVSCSGGNDGTATASATGGTSPYSFAWSSGGTTATETGLAAGTYTVTITDDNGCTDTETVTITEPAALVASTVVDQDVSCNGGSDGEATAAATGGTSPYSFAWSSGGTTATETGLSAGTYTVTVTDDNGCTDTETVTITEPAALIASAVVDQNISCNGGNDGQATASATGGTTPYSFSWSSGGTTATETGLVAGTYTVTITDDNGCTDTETVTITEPTLLVASIDSSSNVSCFGLFDGSAHASASGGTAPYSFLWSSGANTASATGLGASTFTVTVTDDNGCTDTAQVTITEPGQLDVTAVVDSNVLCNGGANGQATATGSSGTAPYSFSWSNGGNSATASNLTVGTYTVTITDDAGCTDTTSVTITEPTLLVASTVVDQDVSCNGGSDGEATAAATGGTSPYTFAWSSGGTAATETGLSAGTYTVTVTDDNGCTDTASVTITEPTALTLNVSVVDVSCFGAADGSLTANAAGGSAPYTYLWSNASTMMTITSMSPGTYNVTVTDDNGCTVTGSGTITQPVALSASISVDSNVSCNGGSNASATASGIGGTSPFSFAWSNGATTATATNLAAGSYTVTITDDNGCTDTESVSITEPTQLVVSAAVDSNTTCASSAVGVATASAIGGVTPYTFAWSSGSTNATANGLGTGTYTVTVTDDNGCIDTTSISIVVEDTIAPFASAIDTVLYLDITGSSSLTGNQIGYNSSDNCGIDTMMLDQNLFDCTDIGPAFDVVLTVEDVNGNISLDTASIQVFDTIAPSILTVSSFDVFLDAAGSASITALMLDSGSSDNCSITNFSISESSFDCINLGANTVWFYAEDVNGNIDSNQVTVNVSDTLLPTVVTQPVTVWLDASGSALLSAAQVDNGSFDNCSVDSIWLSDTLFNCADTSALNTVQLYAEDQSGNVDSAAATITVLDTTPPQISVQNATLYLDAFGAVNLNVVDVVTDTTENCAVDVVTLSQSAFACADTGTNAIDVSVFDISGNSTSYTVEVTVLDTTSPNLQVFALTTLYLDNSGSATITGAAVDSASSDNCGISTFDLSQNSFDCSDIGLNVVTFTATDISGNSNSVSVNIEVLDTLYEVDITLDSALLCSGDSNGVATASASGMLATSNYVWSNGATSAQVNSLFEGTYYVTATDANGCTAVDSVTLIEPSAMVVSLTANDITCNTGNDGFVSSSVSGGTPGYSYAWNTSAVTDSIGGLTAGLYTLTVTDTNGCGVTADTNLVEPTPLVIDITASDSSLCVGDSSAFITANFSGSTSPYTFVWDVGFTSTNDTVFGLGAGTYFITATDTNGCVSDSSFVIAEDTLPIVSLMITEDTVCAGTVVDLSSVNPVGGSYTGIGVLGDSLVTTGLTGMIDVSYSFTDNNGCSAEANDSVFVLPQAVISFSENPLELCAGEQIDLDFASPAGGVYTSPFIVGEQLIAPDTVFSGPGGLYTFQNECGFDLEIFSLEVSPLPEVDLGNDTLLCNASQLTLDAGEQDAYSWSTEDTTRMITLNDGEVALIEDQTIVVTVTNSQGCQASDTVFIDVEDQPVFTLGENIYACMDSVITLSVPNEYDGYLWSTGETATTIIAHNGSITPPGEYDFWVEGSNDGGCSYSDSIVIRILDCDSVFVAVEEVLSDVELTLYPNPARDVLNIAWSGGGIEQVDEIRILSAMGEMVAVRTSEEWVETDKVITLPLGDLANGLYFLETISGDKRSTRRFIVGK